MNLLSVVLLMVSIIAPVSASAAELPPAKPRALVLPPAPDGVVIHQNVAYLGPGREEKLDLYLPANRPLSVKSPAVVIIHGGGWSGGDKAAGREFNIGTTLAKAGYVCASINYWLAAEDRWPQDLYDCKNAVRFLRANTWKYQIDDGHVGVIGGSAGGHLSLMVGYTSQVPELEPNQPYPGISDEVQAVVDMYGVSNLFTWQTTDDKGNPTGRRRTKCSFLQGSPRSNYDAWKQASPVFHVGKNTPPTLVLHGTADTTIDRDQSRQLAAKLKEEGVEHQLAMLEGIGHTFDLQTWQKKPLPIDLRPIVTAFLDKYLRPGKTPH